MLNSKSGCSSWCGIYNVFKTVKVKVAVPHVVHKEGRGHHVAIQVPWESCKVYFVPKKY
jgi:hypothetical protein